MVGSSKQTTLLSHFAASSSQPKRYKAGVSKVKLAPGSGSAALTGKVIELSDSSDEVNDEINPRIVESDEDVEAKLSPQKKALTPLSVSADRSDNTSLTSGLEKRGPRKGQGKLVRRLDFTTRDATESDESTGNYDNRKLITKRIVKMPMKPQRKEQWEKNPNRSDGETSRLLDKEERSEEDEEDKDDVQLTSKNGDYSDGSDNEDLESDVLAEPQVVIDKYSRDKTKINSKSNKSYYKTKSNTNTTSVSEHSEIEETAGPARKSNRVSKPTLKKRQRPNPMESDSSPPKKKKNHSSPPPLPKETPAPVHVSSSRALHKKSANKASQPQPLTPPDSRSTIISDYDSEFEDAIALSTSHKGKGKSEARQRWVSPKNPVDVADSDGSDDVLRIEVPNYSRKQSTSSAIKYDPRTSSTPLRPRSNPTRQTRVRKKVDTSRRHSSFEYEGSPSFINDDSEEEEEKKKKKKKKKKKETNKRRRSSTVRNGAGSSSRKRAARDDGPVPRNEEDDMEDDDDDDDGESSEDAGARFNDDEEYEQHHGPHSKNQKILSKPKPINTSQQRSRRKSTTEGLSFDDDESPELISAGKNSKASTSTTSAAGRKPAAAVPPEVLNVFSSDEDNHHRGRNHNENLDSDKENPEPSAILASSRRRVSSDEESDVPEEVKESPRRFKMKQRRKKRDPDDDSDEDDGREVRAGSGEISEEDDLDKKAILDARLRTQESRVGQKAKVFTSALDRLKQKRAGNNGASSSARGSGSAGPSSDANHIVIDDSDEEESENSDIYQYHNQKYHNDEEELEGFIDDENADPYEQVELPGQFGSGNLMPKDHFKIVVQYHVNLIVQGRKFLRAAKDSDYFKQSLSWMRGRMEGILDSGVTSSVWGKHFEDALTAFPEFYEEETGDYEIGLKTRCLACGMSNRISSTVGICKGQKYDHVTFEDVSDAEDSSDGEINDHKYPLGKFCAKRAIVYHDFRHWEYNLHWHIFALIEKLLVHDLDDSDSEPEAVTRRKNQKLRNIMVPLSGSSFGRRDREEERPSKRDPDAIVQWLEDRGYTDARWNIIERLMSAPDDLRALYSRRGLED